MSRKDHEDEFEDILESAIEVAQTSYANAVAAQILGEDDREHWSEFEKVMRRAYILSTLVGESDVYERALRVGSRLSFDDADVANDLRTFDKKVELTLEVGEFDEAVQSFDTRVPRLRSEVERLRREAQSVSSGIAQAEKTQILNSLSKSSVAINQSFFMTGIDDVAVLSQIKQAVADAIRGDIRLVDFIDRAELEGARNLTRARLETVYRNNLSSAFNEGRVNALSSAEVQKTIPLVMLVEIRDRRTRGNPAGLYPDRGMHYQMHGYVETLENMRNKGIIPPNGHNCRGGIRGIPRFEAEQKGWVDKQGNVNLEAIRRHNGDREGILLRGDYPDPGWN